MRTWIAAVVVAAGMATAGGGRVQAQVFTGAGGPVALTPGYAPGVTYSSAYVTPMAYGAVKPYSYYVLPAYVPSRVYVGPNAFPFYGQPYGHAYDRWTWQYMSEPYYGGMARYYYPPLGF